VAFKRTNILAFSVSGLFVAGYFPAIHILVEKWVNSDEYTHAFITVPIILYMVWSRRASLQESQADNSSLGLLLVIFSTTLYLFSLLTRVHTLITFSMFLTIVGVVICLAGARAIREIAIPLLLLAMLIPVPEQLYTQLTFPLQLKVSQASEMIIRMFGVPLFREGNIMSIPEKSFEVVEACSGLRSVITLMTLSVIMGYFLLRNTSSKLLLVAGSIPAAVLANLLRIVVMVLLYHFFKLDVTEGALHTLGGMAVFVVALGILFIMQRALEFWEQRERES
jgi:exosortase A